VGQELTWPVVLLNKGRGAETALLTGLAAGGVGGVFWLVECGEGAAFF